MNSSEIRSRYLEFFRRHQHTVVSSSSLIPANDPTLYFTNAGMVQFKDIFLGKDHRNYRRATTVQKCLRVSGKHNDLENVGHTARHHTFFEMLGNFSFGDYFKAEAIALAWEFLTQEMRIDSARLWVTVYEEDEEALAIWRDKVGVPEERIQKLGTHDNFWSMGDTGPCGPCTEIHYDHGPKISADLRGPAGGDPRYVEIWNLVFMQYDRSSDGVLTPLPRPSIDTGMGLERLTAVVQGVYANYDTDLFQVVVQKAASLAKIRYGEDPVKDVALKVIADHSRAATFLIADGVMPSNEERGYVLRRIMRRGIRYGVKIGLGAPFMVETVKSVIQHFGTAYPELVDRAEFITEVVQGEELRFAATLERGMALLERAVAEQSQQISGQTAFTLADTFGFPVDLTQLIAAERGVGVDEEEFKKLYQEQKERSRKNWEGSGEKAVSACWYALADQQNYFSGYEHDRDESTVTQIIAEEALVPALMEGQEGDVLAHITPFYAASGGQVGDTGWIRWEHGEARVLDSWKPVGQLHAHRVRVHKGILRAGMSIRLEVDSDRRDRSRRNHTGTHLLHAALRSVLGGHVSQKGSLVAPDRLRFDFAHHKPMTSEELKAVEDMVNGEIMQNGAVSTAEMSQDAARAAGAMALFGEKYGDQVRVVRVEQFSMELCGGTHVKRAGDIGCFKILSEEGIAAGVRRIEAQTGWGALAHIRVTEARLEQAAAELKSTPAMLVEAVSRLVAEKNRLSRELEQTKRDLARAAAGNLEEKVISIGTTKVLAAELSIDPEGLREEADRWRDKLGSSVVVLVARAGEDVRLVVGISKDLAGKTYHAGKIIGVLAQHVGGKGGGRPDFAQAGGKEPSGIPALLAATPGVLQS
jgi:alanyl-tRNA synthetase